MKPCKLKDCDKKRFANQNLCRSHWYEREREKKAKKKERKLTTKKYKDSELEKWKKKTWRLMSEWVRRKDTDRDGFASCFTCDARFHWKQLQAGHRHHRRLDYDERNIKKQCWRCNGKQSRGGLSGNLGEYEYRLQAIYGMEWCAKLKLDANTEPPITLDQVKKRHDELKDLLEKL